MKELKERIKGETVMRINFMRGIITDRLTYKRSKGRDKRRDSKNEGIMERWMCILMIV